MKTWDWSPEPMEKKLDVVDPCAIPALRDRDRCIVGTLSPASLVCLVTSRPVRNPVSKNKVESDWERQCRPLASIYMHTCIRPYEHTKDTHVLIHLIVINVADWNKYGWFCFPKQKKVREKSSIIFPFDHFWKILFDYYYFNWYIIT